MWLYHIPSLLIFLNKNETKIISLPQNIIHYEIQAVPENSRLKVLWSSYLNFSHMIFVQYLSIWGMLPKVVYYLKNKSAALPSIIKIFIQNFHIWLSVVINLASSQEGGGWRTCSPHYNFMKQVLKWLPVEIVYIFYFQEPVILKVCRISYNKKLFILEKKKKIFKIITSNHWPNTTKFTTKLYP